MVYPAKVFQKTMSEIEQTSYQEIAGCKKCVSNELVKKCDTLVGKKHI